MPKMVRLAAAKGYKPKTEQDKANYEAIKKLPVREYDYVTAMENIENSGGMFEIVPEETAAVAATGPRSVDDMSNDELKLAMLSLGIKTEKKMKRSDMILLVKSRMMEIDVDESPDDDEDSE